MQDMSTISAMLTPLSNFYLETSNSEDYSDYYYYLDSVDKHADSIISTEQAKKISSKKANGESLNVEEKKGGKEGFEMRNKEIREKAQDILKEFAVKSEKIQKKIRFSESKEYVVGSPFTPLALFEKNSEEKEKEELVRTGLLKKYEEAKMILIKEFEEKKNSLIEDKRELIQRAWRSKMFELNGKLQQAEWGKIGQKDLKSTGKETELKNLYKHMYQEALAKEKKILETEIDLHFSEQFQAKLSRNEEKSAKKQKSRFGAEELKEQIRCDQESLISESKNKWKKESEEKFQKISKETSKKELKQLEEYEKEAKVQVKGEISEIIIEAEKEILKEYELELLGLKKNHEENARKLEKDWADQCVNEFILEQSTEAISVYKQEIEEDLEKEIMKSIRNKVETKVLQCEQERIYQTISEELSQTHEFYRREIENILKAQQGERQKEFQEEFAEKIRLESTKKVSQKTKELQIRYAHKLESLKISLKKDFEDHYTSESKVTSKQKLKENLHKEKTILAQLKAKSNIQVNKYNSEIQSIQTKLEQEISKLEQKSREFQVKSRVDSEYLKTEESLTKVPAKPSHSFHCKVLTGPLLPPSLSASEIKQHESHFHKTHKITDPTPRNYLDHEKGPRKHSENTKSLSYDSLKLKAKEKLKVPKVKQSMYHDLLRQKFGFIQPRLK